MSRTIRRKNAHYEGSRGKQWYLYESIEFFKFHWVYIPLEKGTKEYKKALADFHRDNSSITVNKEPGPYWYRNLMTERPLRRKHKNELRKFMLDSEYEPEILSKGKLKYWT